MTYYWTAVHSSQVKAIAHNTMCARTAPKAARLTWLGPKYRDITSSSGFRLSRVLPDMTCWPQAATRASNRIV